MGRVEALQTFGPQPLWVGTRTHDIDEATACIARIQSALHIQELPPDPEAAACELHGTLSQITTDWFQQFCDAGREEEIIDVLPDAWIAALGGPEGEFDQWYVSEFMRWGQDGLPLVIEGFLDGVAEGLVDNAFAEPVTVFPRTNLLSKLAFCQANPGAWLMRGTACFRMERLR